MRLLRARFLFDGYRLLKGNLAVLLEKGTVVDVGEVRVLEHAYSIRAIDLGDGLLFPGFVNLHTHLELSYLKGALPEKKGFLMWLANIIAFKRKEIDENVVVRAADSAIEELMKSGVRVVADVSNTLSVCGLLFQRLPLSVVFFERYAALVDRAEEVIATLDRELEDIRKRCKGKVYPAPHALYSTHPDLISYIAVLNRDGPISLHFLESEYERLFLKGRGALFELLNSFSLTDKSLNVRDPIDYIARLGLLRKGSILVHCVDAGEDDFLRLRSADAHVCLCLRSNDYISGRLPDLKAIVKSGVRVGIGTDSLASNSDLNFLNELRFLYKHAPFISPQTIFSWATSMGAEALFMRFGFLKDAKAYPCFIYTFSSDPLEEILDKGGEDVFVAILPH